MDPAAIDLARAEGLLERLLANRSERTRQAYARDVEEFGRFAGEEPVRAVARLLRAGSAAARNLLVDYAIELRALGRAPSTVGRRLAALRALGGLAWDLGLIDRPLEVPTDAQVAAAIRERADQASYIMPRHPNEIDRLDVQHYGLRAALRANSLAPAGLADRVLDVGAGTGQWASELCDELPGAVVVGLDLVAGKPGRPSGYYPVKGNVLQGLPFGEGRFDLVHQRLLVSGVPVESWPEVVGELVRVTRRGGWVELVEPMVTMQPMGPATSRLNGIALEMAGALRLDTGNAVFASLDGWLRDAGLTGVTRTECALPVGRWGGDVGLLVATNIRAAFTRLCEIMVAHAALAAEEAHELIQRAQEEWERDRMEWTFAVAYGRRPD